MSGTVAEVSGRLERFFLSQGYRLESGTTSDGVYGTGSDLWRILFGAFAKRYKFLLGVTPNHNGTVCNVFLEKGMSGAMGGAIGYMRMKKELQRVRNEIAAM